MSAVVNNPGVYSLLTNRLSQIRQDKLGSPDKSLFSILNGEVLESLSSWMVDKTRDDSPIIIQHAFPAPYPSVNSKHPPDYTTFLKLTLFKEEFLLWLSLEFIRHIPSPTEIEDVWQFMLDTLKNNPPRTPEQPNRISDFFASLAELKKSSLYTKPQI